MLRGCRLAGREQPRGQRTALGRLAATSLVVVDGASISWWRDFARSGWASGSSLDLFRGRVRGLNIVMHNFMDAAEAASGDREVEERLVACSFRGAVKREGDWVAVPMCSMNAEEREQIYAEQIDAGRPASATFARSVEAVGSPGESYRTSVRLQQAPSQRSCQSTVNEASVEFAEGGDKAVGGGIRPPASENPGRQAAGKTAVLHAAGSEPQGRPGLTTTKNCAKTVLRPQRVTGSHASPGPRLTKIMTGHP